MYNNYENQYFLFFKLINGFSRLPREQSTWHYTVQTLLSNENTEIDVEKEKLEAFLPPVQHETLKDLRIRPADLRDPETLYTFIKDIVIQYVPVEENDEGIRILPSDLVEEGETLLKYTQFRRVLSSEQRKQIASVLGGTHMNHIRHLIDEYEFNGFTKTLEWTEEKAQSITYASYFVERFFLRVIEELYVTILRESETLQTIKEELEEPTRTLAALREAPQEEEPVFDENNAETDSATVSIREPLHTNQMNRPEPPTQEDVNRAVQAFLERQNQMTEEAPSKPTDNVEYVAQLLRAIYKEEEECQAF